MSSISIGSSWEAYIGKDPIEYNYLEWLSCYEKSVAILRCGEVTRDDELMAIRHHKEAVRYLQNAVECFGEGKQQLIKVKALLLLVKLYNKEWDKKEREGYFYKAVELAQEHLWDDFQNSLEGKEIGRVYLSDINSNFQKVFKGRNKDPLIEIVLETAIMPESRRRILERELIKKQQEEELLKEEEYIKDYFQDSHTSNQVIKKLESIYGPIRLLIVSEDSDEIVMSHRLEDSKARVLKQNLIDAQHITLNIFDKPRKYAVIIDRWNGESADPFEEYRLARVVNPLIDYCIKMKEREFFINTQRNTSELEMIEKNTKMPTERNDYRALVTDIIEKYVDPLEFHESREDGNYIDNLLKALDICRSLTLGSENLAQEIDTILWGRIERKVLRMVKTMLLSRSETMNGSGHPFGLSKKNIPLEWRIYSIIRAYESISCVKTPEQTMEIMKQWAQDGHFDSDILHIFTESFTQGAIVPKSPKDSGDTPSVSLYRKERYVLHIQSWSELMKMAREVGQMTYIGRIADVGTDIKDLMFRKADKLCMKLLKKADIRKLFIIKRHGITDSDDKNWVWLGDENELLNKKWEADSFEKWFHFHGLAMKIFSTLLIRGRQTASIICKTVRECMRNIEPVKVSGVYMIPSCISCRAITLEETITNPKKDMENDRYYSYAHSIFTNANTKWLVEFLTKLIFSPEETVNMFIIHKDSGWQLIFWLKNLFSQDRISGKKISIENDEVNEAIVRWGKLLSEKEKETRGLIFSTENWKTLVPSINILTEKIFSDVFYNVNDQRVNLIDLHDEFLDFIDVQKEYNPELLDLSMEQIRWNPSLQHIYPLLKWEGMIE